jgi:hypothetical protein
MASCYPTFLYFVFRTGFRYFSPWSEPHKTVNQDTRAENGRYFGRAERTAEAGFALPYDTAIR